MKNTIEIFPASISAIVRKPDATIIYTTFDKVFVCTNDSPKLLPNGNLLYVLKGRAQQ